jgi:protein-tyrosine phosphatase
VIDLHCHILPGIDDGPRDMDESVRAARAMSLVGVRTLAATPHVRADYPRVVPDELGDRCAALQRELDDAQVPLEVVAGGEVDLLWASSASADELRLVSYAQRGTDLLLETPYGPLPPSFRDLVRRLAQAGYRLLLAHPERSPTFQQRPELLDELVGEGVLAQVTGEALRRPRRSGSGTLARRLVANGKAHVLASDAHGTTTPDRILLADAAEAAEAIAPGRGRWMVTGSPAAILAGRPLEPPPATSPSRARRLLERLGR